MEDLIGFLGACSALSAIATFLSCRSCVGALGKARIKPNRFWPYRKLYGLHTVLWVVFGAFLLTHLSVASRFALTTTSFEGNPPTRFVVLGLGGAIFVLGLALFGSCRVYPKLHRALTGKEVSQNRAFMMFFRLHSYQWILLIALILAHLALGEGLN